MCDNIHYFETAHHATAVALPFNLDRMIEEWAGLRSRMISNIPEEFTRAEWAYLISFLDNHNLIRPFNITFGHQVRGPSKCIEILTRPRGPVAVWLPNNVSLLGPLTIVLLSLTGNQLIIKGGSQTEDLAGTFLRFAAENLPPGILRSYIREMVQYSIFDRDDSRSFEMAAKSKVRIIFGSDNSAAAINAMPHPIDSLDASFTDKRSEAWVEKSALTRDMLSDLIKVFGIYGQAGCTSPRRVVLIDGSLGEAMEIRDNLLDLWPAVITRDPAAHIASENIMARQWAAALGWNAALAGRNGAVIAAGPPGIEEFTSYLSLMIVPATLDQALSSLPPNIQTIGHGLADPKGEKWLKLISHSQAKRFVPIQSMHKFGPIWDGQAYWQLTFEEVQIEI